MENNEINNDVKENIQEGEMKNTEVGVKNDVTTEQEVKKEEKNLEEPTGNSYAFLIIVFVLLIAAVIVMPMILNR